jgi:hypothetical protein
MLMLVYHRTNFDFMNTCLGNMTGKHFSPNDSDVSNGECLLQTVIPSSSTLTNDRLLGNTCSFLDQDCLQPRRIHPIYTPPSVRAPPQLRSLSSQISLSHHAPFLGTSVSGAYWGWHEVKDIIQPIKDQSSLHLT